MSSFTLSKISQQFLEALDFKKKKPPPPERVILPLDPAKDVLSFCIGTSSSSFFPLLDRRTLLNLGITSHALFKHCSPYIGDTFWFQQAISLAEHSAKVCKWYKPKKVRDQVGDALNLPLGVTHLIILNGWPIASASPVPPLTPSLPETITHLTFGLYFPHPIDHLPPNLTHLTLADNYNNDKAPELGSILPPTLTHLTLGGTYSLKILSFPSHLVYLRLGYQYDHDVSEIVPDSLRELYVTKFARPFAKPLPLGLTHLIFDDFTSLFHPLENLPQSITHLRLPSHYHEHFVLPSSIKYLFAGQAMPLFDSLPNGLIELIADNLTSKTTLPDSLQILNLRGKFDCSIVLPHSLTELTIFVGEDGIPQLPPSLVHLYFNPYSTFNKPLELPNSLKSLHLSASFNHPLTSLPSSLRKLWTGKAFNQSVDNLPSSIRELHLGDSFNQSVDSLPPLIELVIGNSFNLPINNLPSTLERLILGNKFNHSVDNLPPSLRSIALGTSFTFPVDRLPAKLGQLVFTGKYFDLSLEKLPESIKLVGACREPACNEHRVCYC